MGFSDCVPGWGREQRANESKLNIAWKIERDHARLMHANNGVKMQRIDRFVLIHKNQDMDIVCCKI